MEKRKLNLLIITTHFPPKKGGVETSNIQYLDFLDRKGNFKVIVLTYENRYEEKFEDRWRKSKIIRIKVPFALLNYMIGLKSVSRIDSFYKKFMYLFLHTFFLGIGGFIHLKEVVKTDIIIANGALIESIVAYVLSIVARKKYSVKWHTDLSDALANVVTALTLRRASSVIVNGVDIKKKMDILVKDNGKSVLVSKHAVDTRVFRYVPQNEARLALNLPPYKFIILFAAALNEVKFCDLIVGAAQLLFEKDSDIFLVIIGEGPLEETVRVLARSKPKSLVFIDHLVNQQTLNLFINASDIVIGCADIYYPSRLVLESLACGTPVLLFNTSGHVEKRRAKLQFNIPLSNVFIIEPTQDKFVDFLLINKKRIHQLRNSKQIIDKSTDYVLQNHSLNKVIEDDFTCLLK